MPEDNQPTTAPPGSPATTGSGKWLVWSNEHRAYWRPNMAGYTTFAKAAGRYTEEQAVHICRDARSRGVDGTPPPETMIREDCISPNRARSATCRLTMDTNLQPMPDAERTAGSLERVVSLGDYVLATKYSDCDPCDPWRVGFVVRIITDKRGETYIIGEQDGTWNDFREYKHAKKITADEGEAWLEANDQALRPGRE